MEHSRKNKRIKQWCLGCLGLLIVGAAVFALWPKSEQQKRAEAYRMGQKFLRATLKAPDTAKFPSLTRDPGSIMLGIYPPDGSYEMVAWVEAEDFGAIQKKWRCRLKKTWGRWHVTGPCRIFE